MPKCGKINVYEDSQQPTRVKMTNKPKILQDAGFREMPERHIQINRNRRLAFSEDAVSDNDEAWLSKRVAETVPETEFWFHFRFVSDETIKGCNQILARMHLTRVTPIIRSGIRRTSQSRPN